MSLGGDEAETPIIKSLFEIKGNSKFKNGKPISEQSADESSVSEDADKVAAPVFKSAGDKGEKKHPWPNPFQKKNGTSEVFKTKTSLWNNPFAAQSSQQNKLSVAELAEKKSEAAKQEVPAWLSAPVKKNESSDEPQTESAKPDDSPDTIAKSGDQSNKLFQA